MDKVVHFEIPADNLERAKKFYTSLFGWKMNDIPEMKYTIVHTVDVDKNNMPKESGAINGGMFKREAKDLKPVLVISVSSIDKSLAKVKSAGGKVTMPKQEIKGMGFYARIQDTEGNVVGLFENIPK